MAKKNYNVTLKAGYILVKFEEHAVLTYEGLIHAVDEETALPEYVKVGSLWDFRTATVSKDFSYKTVMDMVNYLKRKATPEWISKRVSLLHDGQVVFGMLKMFQILVEDMPVKFKLFLEEEEAVRWVKG
ncbi:MAG: hypothetical protein WC450_07170 [Candidatus Omnitrophota bacterium]|jgi:hypothetical protein